jgi:hypothetical protein
MTNGRESEHNILYDALSRGCGESSLSLETPPVLSCLTSHIRNLARQAADKEKEKTDGHVDSVYGG